MVMEQGMEQGPSMDPLSRTPRVWEEEKRKDISDAQTEANLREKAGALDLKSSREGTILVAMVTGKLTQRIDELITADPMATAYSNIIKELGNRENIARKAVSELYKRHLKREEHTE